ncbi:hypothetical protein Tco_1108460 [Tanacetum coccineum]
MKWKSIRYDDKVKDGEEDKEGDMMNVNLEGGDVDMTEDDTTKDTEDAHVTLTAATPVVQQQSSSVSDLVSKVLFLLWMKWNLISLSSKSNPFAEAISSIPGIVDEYLGSKMKEAVDVAIQLKSNKFEEFLNLLDSNMQETYPRIKFNTKHSKDQVLKLRKQGTIKIKMKNPPLGSNRGTKRRKIRQGIAESSKDKLVRRAGQQVLRKGAPDINYELECMQSAFDEFMDTPIVYCFSCINRLKIDHLTQELLTGPTYDLIKGTCKSVAELDYHLEEVFKATNEQLDWNNLKIGHIHTKSQKAIR